LASRRDAIGVVQRDFERNCLGHRCFELGHERQRRGNSRPRDSSCLFSNESWNRTVEQLARLRKHRASP
jgi:hypothetical protein